MNFDSYSDLKFSDDFGRFEFNSIGKKGFIPKRIVIIPTEFPDVYNLAFGNICEKDNIDDHSISDNGDRNKILATIAKAIELYTTKYPERWIYFRGNTKGRTRLYRMAVGIHLEELSKKFEIYAELDDDLVFFPFEKNMPIFSFLIKTKKT